MRVEDAMHATRAANQEGILPGGGVALLRASNGLKPQGLSHDEEVGYNIVVRACRSPIKQIVENAGEDGEHRGREGAGQRDDDVRLRRPAGPVRATWSRQASSTRPRWCGAPAERGQRARRCC